MCRRYIVLEKYVNPLKGLVYFADCEPEEGGYVGLLSLKSLL